MKNDLPCPTTADLININPDIHLVYNEYVSNKRNVFIHSRQSLLCAIRDDV